MEATEQGSASKHAATVNVVVLVLNCVLLAGAAAITSQLRVRFLVIFEEMGVILPPATRLVLCLPPAVHVACFVAAIGLVVAKEFVLSPCVSWTINLVLPAAVALFLMVYVALLYLPLSNMIMGLSE